MELNIEHDIRRNNIAKAGSLASNILRLLRFPRMVTLGNMPGVRVRIVMLLPSFLKEIHAAQISSEALRRQRKYRQACLSRNGGMSEAVQDDRIVAAGQ